MSDNIRATEPKFAFVVVKVHEGKMRSALNFFNFMGWKEVPNTFLLDARLVALKDSPVVIALREERDGFGHPSPRDAVGFSVGNVSIAFAAFLDWAKKRRLQVEVIERADRFVSFSLHDIFPGQIVFVE